MYRECFRADGSQRGAGHGRAEVPVQLGAGASGDAAGVDHVAATERDSRNPRIKNLEVVLIPGVSSVHKPLKTKRLSFFCDTELRDSIKRNGLGLAEG